MVAHMSSQNPGQKYFEIKIFARFPVFASLTR